MQNSTRAKYTSLKMLIAISVSTSATGQLQAGENGGTTLAAQVAAEIGTGGTLLGSSMSVQDHAARRPSTLQSQQQLAPILGHGLERILPFGFGAIAVGAIAALAGGNETPATSATVNTR